MDLTKPEVEPMTRKSAHLALVVASVICLIGCAQEVVAEDPDLLAPREAHDAVIVGGINWQEASSLPDGTAERANSRSVGYLSLPAAGTRCTGFLIAPDVLMTNEHCVRSASGAQGARAWFAYETGGPQNDPGYDCSTFLGNDAGLDFALLRCAGNPGDVHGVVSLSSRTMARDASIYVIHQNCDYYNEPGCAPTKKYSPGRITQTTNELGHDADTLGGSSGSPVFSSNTHDVVGLHHVGLGNDGRGRGTGNRAVPMSAILPVLQQRYPGIALGARAPQDVDASDGYEPNDTAQTAVAVQLPFASVGARIEAGDVDHFSFVNDGSARSIRLTFTHAAGDLDLYVYNAQGQELARSIGTTDEERIEQALPSGTIVVRVVGYRGATGPYVLDLR
jgi:hypothetical protein